MHKIFSYAFLAAFAFAGVLSPVAGAQTAIAAANDLEVEFENGSAPLFGVTNFAPGDSAEGWIDITNNTDETKYVMTEAINASDPDSLGDSMTLVITGSLSGEAYSNSFSHFLTSGEIELSPLAAHSTERYAYEVTFGEAAGNALQDKELGFDICIGFKAEDGGVRCGGTVIGGENDTDGGGGGGGSNLKLVIRNEHVESVNTGAGTAVIAWDTNILSTSQVVFGPATGTYNLDLNQPFFGYPYGTAEITTKVTSHFVGIAGLVPGQEYKYRVISRASPPTVSYEHTFVVPVPAGPFVPPAPVSNPVNPGFMFPSEIAAGNDASAASGTPDELPLSEQPAGLSSTANVAAAFFGLPMELAEALRCAAVALLMLLIAYAFWALFLKKARGGESLSLRLGFLAASVVLGVILLLLFAYPCPVPYLVIFALLFAAGIAGQSFRKRGN